MQHVWLPIVLGITFFSQMQKQWNRPLCSALYMYMATEFLLHRFLFKDNFGSGFWHYSSSSAINFGSGSDDIILLTLALLSSVNTFFMSYLTLNLKLNYSYGRMA